MRAFLLTLLLAGSAFAQGIGGYHAPSGVQLAGSNVWTGTNRFPAITLSGNGSTHAMYVLDSSYLCLSASTANPTNCDRFIRYDGGTYFQIGDTGAGFQMLTLAGKSALNVIQGARIGFDGDANTKYISSDGTSLVVTGLGLKIPNGLQLDLGSGASDYLTSDGSAVVAAGSLNVNSQMYATTVGVGASGITGNGSNFLLINPGSTGGSGNNVCIGNGTGTDCDGYLEAHQLEATRFDNKSLIGSGVRFSGVDTYVATEGITGTIHLYVGTSTVAKATSSGFTIGSTGTAISSSIRGTGTLDFASAAAGACSADLTIAVTGAVAGSDVDLGPPAARVAGAVFDAWVSAADTVTVRHCCVNSVACDPASGTFSARVWNP